MNRQRGRDREERRRGRDRGDEIEGEISRKRDIQEID
jgi:hypothetical protein